MVRRPAHPNPVAQRPRRFRTRCRKVAEVGLTHPAVALPLVASFAGPPRDDNFLPHSSAATKTVVYGQDQSNH